MTITIRISGEHAQAAAETLTKTIGLPIGRPEGQPDFVKMTEDGKAEVLLGVNARYFNSIVAPAIAPHIRLPGNPDGLFSPEATWAGDTLELKAL